MKPMEQKANGKNKCYAPLYKMEDVVTQFFIVRADSKSTFRSASPFQNIREANKIFTIGF
jgi:hypothetical protein